MCASKLVWFSSVAAAATLCCGSQLAHIEQQLGIENIELPTLDLSESQNSEIQVLGNFRDLNIYKYSGQNNFTGETDNTTSWQNLIYYSNETLLELYRAPSSNESFSIDHIVPLGSDSFILSGSGTIYGQELDHQLMLNLSTLEYKTIFNQSLPQVNAITVVHDKVYFGGSFTYNVSNQTTHSIIAWDPAQDKIENLTFGGFESDSMVNSIVKWDDQNLLFAGNFSTIGNTKMLKNSLSSNASNTSIPELGHPVSLRSAQVQSAGILNENQLICPSASSSEGTGWLQNDTSVGQIEFTLAEQTRASKIRLYNSPYADEQVSLFRILTQPSDSIMNLTYLNPSTGSLSSCDAWCPLYALSNLSATSSEKDASDMVQFLNNETTLEWSSLYQDFAFVDEVPLASLTFMALDSYGSSVGLKSLELYENKISVYANNSLNEPNCIGSASNFTADPSDSFLWLDNSTDGNYIYTQFDTSQGEPSVEYSVPINYPGEYTVNVFTPGCLADNFCSASGIVNATLRDKQNSTILSTIMIYQNNDYEKYDTLYSGYLDSSVSVSLAYESSITDAETQLMVADRVEVVIDEYDSSVFDKTESLNVLNGLLQYSLSNSSSFLGHLQSNSTTDIMSYSASKFPKRSNLYADKLENDLTVLSSLGQMASLTLNQNLDIENHTLDTIGQKVNGILAYSGGLAFMGSFNDTASVGALGFNGTLFALPGVDRTTFRANNLTIMGEEILIFDDQYAINVTSNEAFHNSSELFLSVFSAGCNTMNDTLFQGSIVRNEYTNLNGTFSISSDQQETHQNSNLLEGRIPYDATYIDNATTVYAFYDPHAANNSFGITVLNKSQTTDIPYKWDNRVGAMAYLKNETLLAIGLESQVSGPQFLMRNTSTNKDIANISWPSEVSINSFIFFEQNKSILVGGSFAQNDTGCSGLCLFDYQQQKWSSFFNNTISGTINSMQLSNKSQLILAGSFTINSTKQASLALVSLDTGDFQVLHGGNDTMKSFVKLDSSSSNSIVVSGQKVYDLRNGNWTVISSEFDESSSFGAAYVVSTTPSSQKQKRDNDDAMILITGDMYHQLYGNISAAFYHSDIWTPFLSTTLAFSSSILTEQPNIYTNKDISTINSYEGFLQSTFSGNSSSSSESPKPSTSLHPHSGDKQNKIARGFIVLIGLALSMGTLAVLGILGAGFSYFFGDSGDRYQSLKPRIDEGEMIDTVPPEKLMKFI
ncbi:LANO_0C06194g1_1 [Lachancea nothofagi CBS 11611]|uniref:LANO_0C06194g1_1 n=1 Tax=Lachancea nothofagi CBS 11611 TaxID=1266666 RepID=A0A1G4J8B1_9SACH|nr:LANO_0C06194g1_1 [Lachancea nothofagi CBS 11611]